MIDAPFDQEFVFHDGRRIKNLLELSYFLENMSQQDFESFVNDKKNDFANWIEYVLHDKELSDALRLTKKMNITKDIIREKIIQITNNSINSSNSVNSVNSVNSNSVNSIKSINSIRTGDSGNINTISNNVSDMNKSDALRKSSDMKASSGVKASSDVSVSEESKNFDDLKNKKTPSNVKKFELFDFSKKHNQQSTTLPHKIISDGDSSHSGNLIWIGIYAILVLLIISIVIYRLW